MKLAVFYSHLLSASRQTGLSLEEIMDRAVAMGYELVECAYQEIQADPEGLQKSLREHGLGVSSVYVSFSFNQALPTEEELSCILDTIRAVGSERMLIIPGFYRMPGDSRETEQFYAGIRLVSDRAASRGIQATLEDYDDKLSPCCRRDQLEALTAAIPSLKLTFDTGNFEYYGEEAVSAYSFLKNRIVHVHLKDRSDAPLSQEDASVRRADGSLMYPAAVGSGKIRISEILSLLAGDGYDGVLTAEFFGTSDMLGTMRVSTETIKAAWKKAVQAAQNKKAGQKAMVVALLCLLAKIVTFIFLAVIILLYLFGPLKGWIGNLFP